MTGWQLWPFVLLGVACGPGSADIKERTGPPQPEETEIVPVGGYEILAGTWSTTRSDEVNGLKNTTLEIQVEKDVLTGTAKDSAVRMSCQASHRTCVGTWSDNTGHGGVFWNFGTDFRSFTGSYDGTINGGPAGQTRWMGTKQ